MRFFLKYILIWILLLVSISAISQGFKKKFIDAEYHYMFEEFSEALPIYLEISNSQPDNANINYRIGICYLHLPDPKENEKALPYLQKAITNINPKYKEGSYLEKGAPKDAFFYLGNVYRNIQASRFLIDLLDKNSSSSDRIENRCSLSLNPPL